MRNATRRTWLAALCALSLTAPVSAQAIYHVDAAAAPGGDGLGWATAFDSLDDALTVAVIGDQVWVRAGVYRPAIETTPGDPRSVTFKPEVGVHLYGGFDGTETSLDARAGLFEATVLSGDVGVPGFRLDNAYHVVHVIYPSGIPPAGVVVDGFQIRDGQADQPGDAGLGAGILCFNSHLRLSRTLLTNNVARKGGGLHAQPGMVRVKACHFTRNKATEVGGALWGQAINYKVTNCEFSYNVCDDRGGAVFLNSTGYDIPGLPPKVLFEGCLFHDNRADRGGAVYLGGGAFGSGKGTFTNCTLAFNTAATRGGGFHATTAVDFPALLDVQNSILWKNVAPTGPQASGRVVVEHSLYQGGHPGAGNQATNPGFVDELARDLRLAPGSPAIDAGKNEFLHPDQTDADDDGDYTEPTPVDLDGEPRIVDDPATVDVGVGGPPVIDLGAYEFD